MDSEVTRLLNAIQAGDSGAAERLLPIVYDELRRLASVRLRREPSGHTLQPTALVHEVYVRLLGENVAQSWDSRSHFFNTAARAMRRILVDHARHKRSLKRGGLCTRIELTDDLALASITDDDVIALDEALTSFEQEEPEYAQIVRLHYFAGLTFAEISQCLASSERTIFRKWDYAKAWLRHRMKAGTGDPD
jgi:RNA polymerase sigma factor (TIGR02999 family)